MQAQILQQGPVWVGGRSKSSVDCWTVAGIVSLRVGPKGRVEDGGGGSGAEGEGGGEQGENKNAGEHG